MKKQVLLSLTALAIMVSFSRSEGQSDSKIAFSFTGADNNTDIYTINPDGTGRVRLTDHPAIDWAATWSPDGSKIAFSSDRDGNWEVYVMNADGSNKVNLTNDPGVDGLRQGAWSPDGSKIAFHSTREQGIADVYVMNADGSNPTQLTTASRSDWPAWSPRLPLETIIETMPWGQIKASFEP